jgi:type II secretory pathway component GspD/PulD (secretin)
MTMTECRVLPRSFCRAVKLVPLGLMLFLFAAAAKPPAVTLDVKDEDVRVILKSMQNQCAIKNLIIDPDVSGKGTFYFTDVPCRTAFDVVFRTMGLAAEVSDDVVAVEKKQ